MLGISASSLKKAQGLALLSGQTLPESWQPLAMKYFGHQFGYLNPDLGDGRGLLLADVETPSGDVFELHLKGSGPTPFSRQGDGRAVLRSSIREFLCSEAMYALGVPSSRALCVVGSQTPVQRETLERAATLLRVTRSHLRFGHFEFAYYQQDLTQLKALSDFVCQHYFPCLEGGSEQRSEQHKNLFRVICERTGSLIAKWQCLGFAHGVMNTDNMSILGETFDFGPYGFLDRFDPGYICNHSDHQGRYAFDKQPGVGHWNLSVLAQAFSPLVDKAGLQEGLKAYSESFNQHFVGGMRQKLGLLDEAENDAKADIDFVMNTFTMLNRNQLDYSWFFRQLSEQKADALSLSEIRDHCLDLPAFDQWLSTYQTRLDKDGQNEQARQTAMLATNPKYILRNHLAQNAISAAEQGDYSEVQRLHQVLRNPYEEQTGAEEYAALPPDWAETLEISCSS